MVSWYNYLNVFGDPDLIPKMEAAIEYAHSKGVIIIAAAGNDGTDSSQMFPARHQNVISVGATNDSDERADFSNYSKDTNIDYLGLAAPGEYVVTVDLDNTTSITSEQYFNGTSASVPLVSGLAALVLSVDDDYSHDEMFTLLRGNADIISISYPDNSSHNWFRINAYQTLADVLDETTNGDDTGDSEIMVQVATGLKHSCVINSIGNVQCWGSDTYGQSDQPSTTFKQIDAGDYHTCGVTDDNYVECWGSDTYGQSNPPSGTFSQVSAGYLHSCGIKSTGSVECWGWDSSAGETNPPSGTFSQVSAGAYHSCGIKSTGSVECWGIDNDGESSSLEGIFTQIAAGGNHTCGVMSSGNVECWGSDSYGQSSPPEGIFTQIDAEEKHTCGVTGSGNVECWGDDSDGQSSPP